MHNTIATALQVGAGTNGDKSYPTHLIIGAVAIVGGAILLKLVLGKATGKKVSGGAIGLAALALVLGGGWYWNSHHNAVSTTASVVAPGPTTTVGHPVAVKAGL